MTSVLQQCVTRVPRSARFASDRRRMTCYSRSQGSTSVSSSDVKIKPDWAGDDLLSKVVNAAISTPILYEAIMKPMARRTLIQTAEKNGIAWTARKTEYEATSELKDLHNTLSNPDLEYPEYYLQPFHAYSEGNLCWDAAFEAESATYSMALRVWPKEDLTWEAAQDRLRDSFLDCVQNHIINNNLPSPNNILDVGCSVGISTRAIHARYPAAQMTGLDLSAYMLAVAAYRDKVDVGSPEEQERKARRTWAQGLAEQTGCPTDSVDLYVLSFVMHEMPTNAIIDVVQEAARVLKPGGVLAITDNNPKSPVIQGLPPALFTLMKSTEPHSDEYYTTDIEKVMRSAGFTDVHTEASDPRHRTVLGHIA